MGISIMERTDHYIEMAPEQQLSGMVVSVWVAAEIDQEDLYVGITQQHTTHHEYILPLWSYHNKGQ